MLQAAGHLRTILLSAAKFTIANDPTYFIPHVFDVNTVNHFGAILFDTGVDWVGLEARQFLQLVLK